MEKVAELIREWLPPRKFLLIAIVIMPDCW